jgi:hypothetical protein
VVLDDCYHLYNYWSYDDKEFFPDIYPSLRYYTLSGKLDHITDNLLLRYIDPILERNCILPLLTI